MSGKTMALIALFVGIGGLAAMNWWTYLNDEGVATRRAGAATPPSASGTGAVSGTSGTAKTAANGFTATAAAAAWQEPEPPKRRPKSGEDWGDPFQVDSSDVIVRAPAGMKKVEKRPAYVVDLILINGHRRLASINGTLHGVGEWVGAAQVVRIDRDGVLLRNGEKREEFVRLAELRPAKSSGKS